MEKLLEAARKVAQEAEVYEITAEDVPVSFEANRLKYIEAKETRGIALRVIVDGRVGLASTSDFDQLDALVDEAVRLARYGAAARFQLPVPSTFPEVSAYAPELEALTVERMAEMGQQMVDAVRAHDPDILCDAGVSRQFRTVRILNSRGVDARFRSSALGVGLHANLVRGTDMLNVYESDEAVGTSLDHLAVVKTLLRKVDLARPIATIGTGEYPVVFTPKGAAGTFLQALIMALNGKMVLQGASPLGDKLGQQVADERFSLVDDATTERVPSSRPFDDEGVPTRRTVLIEHGVVQNYYYDLQTAGMAGMVTTGNGYRGLATLPAPSPSTLLFSTGDLSYEEMLADLGQGLVVDQVMGAWAGNVLAGEFSANVHLGYKVENGRVVGRVKDTMVAGQIFGALQQLAGIGREAVWLDGSMRVPHLYFRGLSVASKG